VRRTVNKLLGNTQMECAGVSYYYDERGDLIERVKTRASPSFAQNDSIPIWRRSF
jgi:hypothetical protein